MALYRRNYTSVGFSQMGDVTSFLCGAWAVFDHNSSPICHCTCRLPNGSVNCQEHGPLCSRFSVGLHTTWKVFDQGRVVGSACRFSIPAASCNRQSFSCPFIGYKYFLHLVERRESIQGIYGRIGAALVDRCYITYQYTLLIYLDLTHKHVN